jgi:acetyltransferase
MLEETKVYRLLKGYRGSAPVDLKKLEETLLTFSQLLVDFPQIKEIDINPMLISEKAACILDARIVVDKNQVCKKHEPHEHIVISPYPKKYETLWTLKNGQEVLLRPIKPEDEPLWLEWFQSLSEESIRYRFFQMLKDTPHEVRLRYCNIDYDREIALVAEVEENGKRRMLGISRVSIETDGKHGEMAFIVSDQWQGLGLGTKMVDYTLDIAKEKGVDNIYAIMLPDNYRALSLTKKMGFNIDYLEDGTIKAALNLKEEDIDIRCITRIEKQSEKTSLPEPPETLASSIKTVAEIKSQSKQATDKTGA